LIAGRLSGPSLDRKGSRSFARERLIRLGTATRVRPIARTIGAGRAAPHVPRAVRSLEAGS
jgi:hypothetical protein